jgi:O-antigen ligase
LVSLVLVAAVAISVSERDLGPDASPGNALTTRTETFSAALDYWAEEPLFGAGLRYFVDPRLETGVAHNLVVNELAEAGVAGLVALVALLVVLLRSIRASRSDLASMALMVFVVEVVASMLDVFWVAGRVGCALVLVGMALAGPGPGRSSPTSGAAGRALPVAGR